MNEPTLQMPTPEEEQEALRRETFASRPEPAEVRLTKVNGPVGTFILLQCTTPNGTHIYWLTEDMSKQLAQALIQTATGLVLP